MSIAAGRLDFKGVFVKLKYRHVERPAAQVEYQNSFVVVFVKTVSQCRRCRLVDYAQNFKSGDCTGVLSGLTLRVVEVSGHCDNGLRDSFTEISLRVGFELLQNHRGNFGRRVVFAVD